METDIVKVDKLNVDFGGSEEQRCEWLLSQGEYTPQDQSSQSSKSPTSPDSLDEFLGKDILDDHAVRLLIPYPKQPISV